MISILCKITSTIPTDSQVFDTNTSQEVVDNQNNEIENTSIFGLSIFGGSFTESIRDDSPETSEKNELEDTNGVYHTISNQGNHHSLTETVPGPTHNNLEISGFIKPLDVSIGEVHNGIPKKQGIVHYEVIKDTNNEGDIKDFESIELVDSSKEKSIEQQSPSIEANSNSNHSFTIAQYCACLALCYQSSNFSFLSTAQNDDSNELSNTSQLHWYKKCFEGQKCNITFDDFCLTIDHCCLAFINLLACKKDSTSERNHSSN